MKQRNESLKKKVASGIIWKLAERMAAQVVSLVVSVILARLLLPEDYGAVSLVTVFITLANVFVSDGFGVALIQKKDADELDFSSVFYFSIFFTVILYIIIFISAPWIAMFYSMPIITPVLRVFALRIPIAGINSVQQAYVSRKMIFKKFFFSTLIGTVFSAIVGIIMAYNGYGVWALVAQYLTNTVVDTIVLWFTVRWRPKMIFSFEKLKDLINYGWKILLQSFLNKLYANIRSLLIGKVYTSADLAYYTKGSQFPNLISANVDTALNSALFPAMSQEQQDYLRVKAIARRATKLCSYIMSPLLLGFAACANSFVIIVLTEKWLPIVPFLQIICFLLLCRPAQTSILQAIKSVGRSDISLKMDIPVRCVGIITLMISLKYGVLYVAISELIVEYFCLFVYMYEAKKIISYNYLEVFYDLGINILNAVIMGFIVWEIGMRVHTNVFRTFIVQIIIGGVTYILISVVTNNENYIYLVNELKPLIRKNKC